MLLRSLVAINIGNGHRQWEVMVLHGKGMVSQNELVKPMLHITLPESIHHTLQTERKMNTVYDRIIYFPSKLHN